MPAPAEALLSQVLGLRTAPTPAAALGTPARPAMLLRLLGALAAAAAAASTALAASAAAPGAHPRVQTSTGELEGRVYDGCRVFRGVPFGESPTGELRWRPPRAKAPWHGVRQATEPAAECPQLDILRGIHFGSEDCLYLSVYSPPQCTKESPCATMFWIYGGAWTIGGNGEFGLYTGEHLAMKHGVVVVSANYRLDVLGWLALGELADEDEAGAYANYGLMDQRLGMQWTRENAAAFGGDPEQVTIFGESAGGFSVCQHITSPDSNGLFSRAIMESGGCDGPFLIQDGIYICFPSFPTHFLMMILSSTHLKDCGQASTPSGSATATPRSWAARRMRPAEREPVR